jgi:uncharacterized protein (TIGR00251 family)
MSGVRLAVYIQPRASKSEFAGLHGGVLKVRIAAPAVDNAANAALIEFLAAHLALPKRSVRLVSGATSRRKLLEFEGITAAQLAIALAPEC